MTTKDVAVRDFAVTPQEVVENATAQAKLLMSIVEQTKCYQEISGKKYLQVEAWETIGAFNRTHAETESITPVIREGETIGYQARVQLWKDGLVVGGAVMPCYFTENCCKGKEGDAKHKACMSAAQTFATSKAYRMNFSYVAILAGYQPLPAEEVTEDMKEPVDKTQHWCKLHNTEFFMRGKMKSFAHPVEGQKDWCYEPHLPNVKQAEKDRKDLWPEGGTKPEPVIQVQGTQAMTSQTEIEGLAQQVIEKLDKDEPPVTPEQLADITRLLNENKMGLSDLGKWWVKKGWKISKIGELKAWQYNEIVAAFKKGG